MGRGLVLSSLPGPGVASSLYMPIVHSSLDILCMERRLFFKSPRPMSFSCPLDQSLLLFPPLPHLPLFPSFALACPTSLVTFAHATAG